MTMERKRQPERQTMPSTRTMTIAAALLILINVASSSEVSSNLPTNHKADSNDLDNAKLKMEARVEEDGIDLNAFEKKDNFAEPIAITLSDHSSHSSFDDSSDSGNPANIDRDVSYVTPMAEPEESLKDANVGSETDWKGSTEFQSKRTIGKETYERNTKRVVPSVAEERGWKKVNLKPSTKDSYLDALDHSHKSTDPNEGVVRADIRPKVSKVLRREYVPGPVYRPETDYGVSKDSFQQTYGAPNTLDYGPPKPQSSSYDLVPTQPTFLPTPSLSYSLPAQSYESFNHQHSYGTPQQSPQTSYGVPNTNYGVPPSSGSSYGTSGNSYLPPAPPVPQQGYGPPSPVYGAPYALPAGLPQLPSFPMFDFSWPFALKLNIFTVAKIILKLVIFKLIVKFIAIICLLLFIPKLEIIKKGDKEGDEKDDEGYRSLETSNSMLERLNILTTLVMGSIEKHEKSDGQSENQIDYDEDCTSFGCRLRKAFISNESWSDYIRWFHSYVSEEEEQEEDHKTKET